MSASNKKKLRKEQANDQMTARQRQEQDDAKKLKIYTAVFLSVMALIVCACLFIGISTWASTGGWAEKATIAATVGGRELNTVEMNYYYIDSINKFYSQWDYDDNADSYIMAIYGLDTTLPLDEQYTDDTKTETWADYFINEAIKQAQHDYAMYDLAMKENFTMSEQGKADYDDTIQMLETYSEIYTGGKVDKYLSALYGNGANLKTYKTYFERSIIASEYYTAHEDTFVYTDEQRDAYQADKKSEYNSYSYYNCYLTYTDFRGEGTEDEDGNVTYSDEQNNEARKKMEEAAKELAKATSVDELKELAEKAPVSEGKTLTVKEEKDVLHSEVSTSDLRDWLSNADRKVGDIEMIANKSTVTDDDGNETTVINGYYVVIFAGLTTNETAMADIGYIYVPYLGGSENEDGEHIHSQEDKDNTKVAVKDYLKRWEEGEKTAASLEELANELINSGDASSGGLVENLNPSSDFAAEIMAWALDENRATGDTEIVEADDGFYLLYYSAKSKLNYRHYMIDNEMRANDYQEWYDAAIAAVATNKGNVSKMDTELVISPS